MRRQALASCGIDRVRAGGKLTRLCGGGGWQEEEEEEEEESGLLGLLDKNGLGSLHIALLGLGFSSVEQLLALDEEDVKELFAELKLNLANKALMKQLLRKLRVCVATPLLAEGSQKHCAACTM